MNSTQRRHEILKSVKRVVLKVGSSVLTSKNHGIDKAVFENLAREITGLRNDGYEIVMISSGAIASGMQKLGITKKPSSIPQKQAIAAVGQSTLMGSYEEAFSLYNQKVAQVLLTHDDMKNRQRFLNARNTLYTLIDYGVIPIINENDSVAVDEIKFGDNDNLAALTTNLVNGDILIILTDIDGLYSCDPKTNQDTCFINIIENVNALSKVTVGDTTSPLGTGGMAAKLDATRKVVISGIPTIIANGKCKGIVTKIFSGDEVGTLFLPTKNKLKSRKHWIAFTLRSKGKIIVDEGAKKAITSGGKSLLPSGIIQIEGNFEVGALVSCVGETSKEFARGLTNYSSKEIEEIKGKKSSEIESILGYRYFDEIIHRDDLVVLV